MGYVVKKMFKHLSTTNGIFGRRFSVVQLDKLCNGSILRKTALDENILDRNSTCVMTAPLRLRERDWASSSHPCDSDVLIPGKEQLIAEFNHS